MKYTLHRLEEYQSYIKTSLPYSETLPTIDGYNFDESTGIMTVNRTTSESAPFFIYVPCRNLKIGDKIKAKIDVKIIAGAEPVLGTTFGNSIAASGSIGVHRQEYTPTKKITDFETVSMEAIYEGYDTETLTVSNDNNGVLYVAFRMVAGYGPSYFQFKNLSIATENNISGITPGTMIYHGLIKYTVEEGFTYDKSVGSHNTEDLSILQSDSFKTSIKFNDHFYSNPPTAYFNTMFQLGGNKSLYEVVLNTTTQFAVDFYIRDLVNNTIIADLSTITVPLYIDFIIIGE